MDKIVVASDSFKGSLSSLEIIKIFSDSLSKISPFTTLVGVGIGDGGEGTVDAIAKIIPGKYIFVNSVKPDNTPHKGKYYISNNNEAFIEVASSSGITLSSIKDPSILTSYGTGLEINDAIKRGIKTIYLGLGGSATNDGGAGLLSAIGIKFYNSENKEFIPVGKTLKQIKNIDISNLNNDINFILMSDVTNPLLGPSGATYTFSKQKGADEIIQEELENNMNYYSSLISKLFNKDCSKISGSGAAGGIAYGCLSFLNCSIKSGIETILDLINFDKIIKDADYIFTGEGKLDSQSLQGKTISGILNRAKKYNIPVIAIVGGVTSEGEEFINRDIGLTSVFTTNRVPLDSSSIKKHSKSFYKHTVENILKLICTAEKRK